MIGVSLKKASTPTFVHKELQASKHNYTHTEIKPINISKWKFKFTIIFYLEIDLLTMSENCGLFKVLK